MDELNQRVADVLTKINITDTKRRIEELGKEASNPVFWQDHQTATSKMKELASLQKEIDEVKELELLLDAGGEAELKKVLAKIETKVYLSGKYDRNDAIVAIHAGQGGTEAMDWSSIQIGRASCRERVYVLV